MKQLKKLRRKLKKLTLKSHTPLQFTRANAMPNADKVLNMNKLHKINGSAKMKVGVKNPATGHTLNRSLQSCLKIIKKNPALAAGFFTQLKNRND